MTLAYRQQGSLTALFSSEAVGPMLREMAGEAGERFTELAAGFTPRLTGRTAESWEQIPVERVRHPLGTAYESGTENKYYKARFLEHGTEPHEAGGKYEGAHHPGTGAHHMTSKAAEVLEAEFDHAIAIPKLAGWAKHLEARANAGTD